MSKKAGISIRTQCKILGTSRAYLYRERKNFSKKRKFDEEIKPKMLRIFEKTKSNAGKRTIKYLLEKEGIKIGLSRTKRLMNELNLKSRIKKKFKHRSDKSRSSVALNLIERNFRTIKPNICWCTDITYIRTGEGWLYLCVFLDIYSRTIVGYSMDNRIDTNLVLCALSNAKKQRQVENKVIIHSDRGAQFTSCAFITTLKNMGFIQSMSGKGSCYDNAVVESFFSTLKKELIYQTTFLTRSIAKTKIFEYIETYYNRLRPHSTLGYRSPMEFEKLEWMLVS